MGTDIANRELTLEEQVSATIRLAANLSDKVENVANVVKGMESRVFEIEQFRNPAAVEGRMRDLFEKLETNQHELSLMGGKIKRMQDDIQNFKEHLEKSKTLKKNK